MIYLASPYSSHDRKVRTARYLSAREFIAKMYQGGYTMPIYSPIVHFHPMAEAHDLPTDHAFWWEINRHYLDLANHLWVLRLEGWVGSKGVAQEVDYWTETFAISKPPIKFVSPILHEPIRDPLR